MSYAQALQFTLVAEGGYSNRANDHGGPTNHGITQATYDHFRGMAGQPKQDVRLITDAEVKYCYYKLYWEPAHCEEMSAQLGICMFDWAVNHGVEGAIKTLQETLGIQDDGVFGPETQHALTAADTPYHNLWQAFNAHRRQWYLDEAKTNPSQQDFIAGWLGRVDRLDNYIERL